MASEIPVSTDSDYAIEDTTDTSDPSCSVDIDGVPHEFPGCKKVRITRDEIADYDGRYEYWDAATETALMVREPTSPYHERPAVRLASMAGLIAATRGTSIEVLGTSDLLVRDAAGDRRRIMQADQVVYTHPVRLRPLGHALEVDAGQIPEVVLEVDLTTDVRRGKLKLYESWGFPEVWVERPDERAPSRPNRKPGLTIYLLGDEGYREASASVAFPTWTAEEIHVGLNEKPTERQPMSEETAAVLRRIGRLMREETGTGPDDDPFLGAEREESRAEGRIEGRVETLKEIVRFTFERRGLPLTPRLDELTDVAAALPSGVILRAAEECQDEQDFEARLGRALVDYF